MILIKMSECQCDQKYKDLLEKIEKLEKLIEILAENNKICLACCKRSENVKKCKICNDYYCPRCTSGVYICCKVCSYGCYEKL